MRTSKRGMFVGLVIATKFGKITRLHFRPSPDVVIDFAFTICPNKFQAGKRNPPRPVVLFHQVVLQVDIMINGVVVSPDNIRIPMPVLHRLFRSKKKERRL